MIRGRPREPAPARNSGSPGSTWACQRREPSRVQSARTIVRAGVSVANIELCVDVISAAAR
ncbi:hypothetical protein OH76DRAFT_1397875 [Lentinus brumalis]|uniref:Uncharacterized protein n=1 Tax=Lentinus brumalis TaxID=2498619 RepID=A0A371DPW4_9APHY|nr:hypothetical protein OH76DRAFT_1397875 [Polyporus brumalis]